MSAAQELARFGVTANIVHPPPTDTGWITSVVEEAITSSSPHGRVAPPNDVAEVITLLAGNQARFISGQVIYMT
jgi:3-oxoacyl-[acyl-carrier protein] reductase